MGHKMSETVRYKGKLTKINKIYGESLENQCKRILEGLDPGFELNNYYDTYAECLLEEYYDKFYVNEDVLYRIEKEKLDTNFDIFEGHKNINDTIDFHVMYYNGGCDLSEALDEVILKINKGE